MNSLQRSLPSFVALALAGGLPLAAQTTVTARSAGAPTSMPDASGRFEHTGITTFQYRPAWTPWTMTGNSGIAANGSAFTSNNPVAPDGTRVAFLQGVGAMSTPFTFAAGTWRLRFFAAQRQMAAVNRQVVRVSIGATEVLEEQPQGTAYAIYTTRPIAFAGTSVQTITFQGVNPFGGDNTAFVDLIQVERIGDWHSAGTWDLRVPLATDRVVVPNGIEVALRGNAAARSVTVHGELLAAFDNATLATDWLMISGTTARFEVGRPLTPYDQTFRLDLRGDNTAEDVMGAGTKFLMAMNGGQIDLHGTPRNVTVPGGRQRAWTRLGATANAGATQITTSEPVAWRAGDEIVIAGSNRPAAVYVDQAEKRTIATVAQIAGGTVLTLTQALSHSHYGASTLTYGNGLRTWTLDRRAEVGLLTHNVRVQGVVSAAEPQFGGHVMLMRGPCCSSTIGGKGRFSSVEFFQMGQKQRLGRYPIHWHMQHAQGQGQFLKHCSVHTSFNRAVTIHGSENVDVEGNVAFSHVGHGIFLEDGSERFNKLYHNLALSTIKPPPGEQLIPSDNSHAELQNRSPATYWITNPRNEFVGNVAGGTVGAAFWFVFPRRPIGLSGDPAQPFYSSYFAALEPIKEPLGIFADNVAHSSMMGFDVNDGIFYAYPSNPSTPNDTVRTNDAWVPSTTANQYLDRFTVYGCGVALYSGLGGPVYEQVRFRECVLADNGVGMLFATYNVLESSAVIADTGTGFQFGGTTAYVVYDGAGRVQDSHFKGFATSPSSLLGAIGGSTLHPGHRWRGLTFDPATPPRLSLPDFVATPPNYSLVNDVQDPRRFGVAILDQDGSLSGRAGWTLIGNHPLMRSLLALPLANSTNVYVTPHHFAHLRVYHPGLGTPCPPYTPPAFCNLPAVRLTRNLTSEAPVSLLNDYRVDSHKQFPIVVNEPGSPAMASYTVEWPVLPSTRDVEVVFDDLQDLAPGSSALVALAQLGSLAPVVRLNGAAIQAMTRAQFNAGTTTGYFVDANAPAPRPVWLRLVKPATGRSATFRVTW